MKDFRDSGHRAYIDVDKLYVDGKRYIPNPDERTRLRHRPQIARGGLSLREVRAAFNTVSLSLKYTNLAMIPRGFLSRRTFSLCTF
jgi:hypothetical protein